MTDALPDPAELTRMLERAVQTQDFDAAFRLAERAAAAGAAHPLVYRLHGADLERRGRSAQAVAMFERALALAPDDAATLNALGFSQTKLGRLAQAAATLERAARLAPQFAPIRFNLGLALEQQGRLNAAEAAYGEAARLDPRHAAALANLAVLHARRSRWSLAQDNAKAALALTPALPTAHLALAMCELGVGELAAAEARLNALLAAPSSPPQERAVALNLLAETLDRAGRSDAAFTAFRAANQGFAQLFGPQPVDGPPTGAALARQLQAQLTDPARTAAATAPPVADAPVFLLSFPRSATTLMGQVLAAHPKVTVSDEQELLSEAALAYLTPVDGLHRLAAADAAALEACRQTYWRRVHALGLDAGPGAGRLFVDKLPMNTLALPLIARLFPGARVIFMVRDPRDVVWSCYRQRFIGSGVARAFTNLGQTAELYDAVMRLARTCIGALDLDVRLQGYEKLVADFDGQTADLCGFLGLEPDPALADFAGGVGGRDVATPSAVQIARGLNADSIGQWRRYRTPMAEVLPVLAPWIETFGYSPD